MSFAAKLNVTITVSSTGTVTGTLGEAVKPSVGARVVAPASSTRDAAGSVVVLGPDARDPRCSDTSTVPSRPVASAEVCTASDGVATEA